MCAWQEYSPELTDISRGRKHSDMVQDGTGTVTLKKISANKLADDDFVCQPPTLSAAAGLLYCNNQHTLTAINIESLLTSSDRTLFRNMQKCEHCLNQLLPPRKDNLFALRPAGHEFTLPTCNYQLHRRSFVVRCLFNFLTA